MLSAGVVSIKQVGTNGQVSIGKEYAGKQIQIAKLEGGALLITPGRFIPDNELWLYNKENMQTLELAIEWAETNARNENFEQIETKINND